MEGVLAAVTEYMYIYVCIYIYRIESPKSCAVPANVANLKENVNIKSKTHETRSSKKTCNYAFEKKKHFEYFTK